MKKYNETIKNCHEEKNSIATGSNIINDSLFTKLSSANINAWPQVTVTQSLQYVYYIYFYINILCSIIINIYCG